MHLCCLILVKFSTNPRHLLVNMGCQSSNFFAAVVAISLKNEMVNDIVVQKNYQKLCGYLGQ